MRSAFVHCAGEISPPNNSFIYPYRFLNVLLSLAIILWLFSSRLEDLILTTALSFTLTIKFVPQFPGKPSLFVLCLFLSPESPLAVQSQTETLRFHLSNH